MSELDLQWSLLLHLYSDGIRFGLTAQRRKINLPPLQVTMKTDFSCCCSSLIPSRDTARCYLLFVLIAFYMLAGAAIFSSLERPAELQAHQLWEKRLRDFGHEHNISREDLKTLLLHYEKARTAGIRTEPGRALWDIPGAFYFVGTVVSTIGGSRRMVYCEYCGMF